MFPKESYRNNGQIIAETTTKLIVTFIETAMKNMYLHKQEILERERFEVMAHSRCTCNLTIIGQVDFPFDMSSSTGLSSLI